jgi:hypothetical protein
MRCKPWQYTARSASAGAFALRIFTVLRLLEHQDLLLFGNFKGVHVTCCSTNLSITWQLCCTMHGITLWCAVVTATCHNPFCCRRQQLPRSFKPPCSGGSSAQGS